jgi:hypothetical protein
MTKFASEKQFALQVSQSSTRTAQIRAQNLQRDRLTVQLRIARKPHLPDASLPELPDKLESLTKHNSWSRLFSLSIRLVSALGIFV